MEMSQIQIISISMTFSLHMYQEPPTKIKKKHLKLNTWLNLNMAYRKASVRSIFLLGLLTKNVIKFKSSI